jgi:hypothetical protein
MKNNKNEAVEANQKMDDVFNKAGSRSLSGDSEVETANHQIQKQFYGNENENNLLPFHIDVNNPPIKK